MVIAVLLATPVWADEAKLPPGAQRTKIELPAREFHEECLELAASQRLMYGYSAPIAVQFNIYYHAGEKMVYPVRKNARNAHGIFVPHKARGYCLMWTNPRAKPVTLEYAFSVGAAPADKK